MHSLKSRIINGETTNGCLMSLSDLTVNELMSQAGFDWIILDLEHGVGNENHIIHQLMAFKNSSTVPLVRVESPASPRIAHVMDAGAMGVMVPRVNTAEEAQMVVEGLHYPPVGKRGVATLTRPSQYGKNFTAYLTRMKEEALCIVQIETKEAVENVEQIAGVSGVDVLFIGPADLSMDMGIYGQFDHPDFIKNVQRVIKVAHQYRKAVGILIFSDADYIKFRNMGIHFIGYSTDLMLLKSASTILVKRMGELREKN